MPPYVHEIKAAGTQENVKLLNPESMQYYKKKQQDGEPVRILDVTQEEVFTSDPVPKKIFTEKELEENRKEDSRPVKRDRKKKEEGVMFEMLTANPYSEGQLEEIRACIASGIPYGEIVKIADVHNTAEQIRESRENYIKKSETVKSSGQSV
ncbi:hypothetical protein D3Z62_16165 [Lachnospiraceae bacterium]|nr:hypothetical protein [Lachnospiraceae bacterium]